MRIRFWGVRGALATPGEPFLGVGGNTPCLEVRDAGGALAVVDAGIGLYWLGRSLLAGPHGRGQGELTLLLSHSHWDHIQGIPFFVPAFIPGNRLRVRGPGDVEAVLEGQLDPAYSPLVSLANLGATLDLASVDPTEPLTVGAISVRHALIPSPEGDGEVAAYRLEEAGRSLVVACEAGPGPDGQPDPALLTLAEGCDLLVHEAYALDPDGGAAPLSGLGGPIGPGHSSFRRATETALAAGVKRLLYAYHHPDHDDERIREAVAAERRFVAERGAALAVDTAREGRELDV